MNLGRSPLLLLLALLLTPLHAVAAKRIALLVGSNTGWKDDKQLQYAEKDARQLGGVLTELGSFRAQDIVTLTAPSPEQLLVKLNEMKRRLKGPEGEESFFLFYYSGHADAQKLHLPGAKSLSLDDLYRKLREMPATVKLGVLDACNSGAILDAKGATPAAPFNVKMHEDGSVRGTVIFTSSGAEELSLEDKELKSSVFTHHFVSGLRGVADTNKDGYVSLEESYRYAFDRTHAETAVTLSGPQKPAHRTDLRGHGAFHLTSLKKPIARLRFSAVNQSAEKKRCFIIDTKVRQLVAEVVPQAEEHTYLALPAGQYEIKCRSADFYRVYSVELTKGADKDVFQLKYRDMQLSEGVLKGRRKPPELAEAFGKTLAADAQQVRNRRPDQLELSTLLAVEALRNSPSLEAQQELRRGLERLPRSGICVKHDSNVLAVAWRPDGQQLATIGVDKTARLWNVKTGSQVAEVTLSQPGTEVAWSHDALLLRTRQSPGDHLLWKIEAGGSPSRNLQDPPHRAIAFDPTGRLLAFVDVAGMLHLVQRTPETILLNVPDVGPLLTFSADGRFLASLEPSSHRARIWDVTTLKQVFDVQIQAPSTWSSLFAISWDGSLLALASREERTVEVWEVDGLRRFAPITHEGPVRALAFTEDGSLLTGSVDKTVRLWDPVVGQELSRMTHPEGIESMSLSPNGQQLATTWNGGQAAAVWNLQTGQELMRLGHRGAVNAVAWSTDGRQLATASDDGTACIWGSAGNPVSRVQGWGRYSGMAFSRDSLSLITTSEDEPGRAWAAATLKERFRLSALPGTSSLLMGLGGKLLVTAKGNSAQLWEVHSGKPLSNLQDEGTLQTLALSPDESTLVTSSGDGTVRIWDTASGREKKRVSHGSTVWSVAISPDGKHLATGGGDRTVRLWELATGKALSKLEHQLPPCPATEEDSTPKCESVRLPGAESIPDILVYSADGRYLATATQDAVVRVWSIELGRELLLRQHKELIRTLAFSQDGGSLAIATGEPEARIWGVETGQELTVLTVEGGIASLQYSDDGHYLVAATRNQGWRIWEASSGRELARGLEETPLEAVVLSPNGRYLATAHEEGDTGRLIYSLFAWRQEDLIAQACTRLRRNMTQEEWTDFMGETEPYQKTCSALP